MSNLQAQRASEEPAIKEATELNESLSNELQAKGKLQSDLVNEVEELKQQRNDLMDQMVCLLWSNRVSTSLLPPPDGKLFISVVVVSDKHPILAQQL